MLPELIISFQSFFSLSFWFFCWEGDFFLQEARFYFWQRDSFFVFIDRPQECIISIPSICNMQNIAHCLSFKKTFSSQYGLKWTQRKSALTENKLLSYKFIIRNNTSASTSASLRKVDFSALKIGMYTIVIRTNIARDPDGVFRTHLGLDIQADWKCQFRCYLCLKLVDICLTSIRSKFIASSLEKYFSYKIFVTILKIPNRSNSPNTYCSDFGGPWWSLDRCWWQMLATVFYFCQIRSFLSPTSLLGLLRLLILQYFLKPIKLVYKGIPVLFQGSFGST